MNRFFKRSILFVRVDKPVIFLRTDGKFVCRGDGEMLMGVGATICGAYMHYLFLKNSYRF